MISGLDAEAAFFAVALAVEGVFAGDGDDVEELSAEAFAGASAGGVIGVAGDDDGGEAVAAGEGEQESAGAFGVVVSADGGEDVVADVSEVEFEVGGVTDAESDGAGHGEEGCVVGGGAEA